MTRTIMLMAALLVAGASTAVTAQAKFRRGDANSDGVVDISDPIATLSYLFLGGTKILCDDAGDANDDGLVDVSDAVHALRFLFPGESVIPAPGPSNCGRDPTRDSLGCSEYESCPQGPIRILRTSPAHLEDGVSVTRETIIEFDGALDPESSASSAVVATFGGRRLESRLQLSADRRRLTLFYKDPLPGSARVRVTIDGEALRDESNLEIDADGDGEVGGVAKIDFDTLSLTVVSGTTVCGRVLASELMQTDNAELVDRALSGVTVRVDALDDKHGAPIQVVTNDDGEFCLSPAPSGRFFVHIDGTTVPSVFLPDGSVADSSAPPSGNGPYYPNVGKAWTSIVGETVDVGVIHLPLIREGTLQAVSSSEAVEITFSDDVLAENPELAGTQIVVPADSLLADDGKRGGAVGISPVPPDRLPGTLPTGLDFPIVITVQTDGATNFDEPAPICFPNLRGLPAGATSALWSFNHDTGQFEIVGPMTVSADGTLVCTDPGVGILAPGWHGEQGGSEGGGPSPSPGDKCAADLAQAHA